MASKPSAEGIVDGSCNLPVNYSGFKILKPGFENEKHQYSLDMMPILLKDTSLPGSLKYPLDGPHPQDVYSISVVPQERDNQQCASQLAFLRFLELPNQSKDQEFSHAEVNCQSCMDLRTDSAATYPSCVVDVNVGKESFKVPESNEKSVESFKSENVLIHLQRVLRRQASVSVGAKLIQLLMSHGSTSPREKTGTERIHEAPNNQWKRYKRAASFDSRKIVLLFSILSIFGTLVLIYLTLKVRQQSVDVTVHS